VKRRSVRPAAASGRDRKRGLESVLQVGSDFYVHASALASRRASRVLANGESFAVFDIGGDILDYPHEALGFFHSDTRYLSQFELKIFGSTPYLLNSYLSDDKAQFRANLTNPDLASRGHGIKLPRDLIQMERSWVLDNATLIHRLRIRNYAEIPLQIPIEFFISADFADIFEVRGVERKVHGRLLRPRLGHRTLRLFYDGLDGVRRYTEASFDSEPRALSRDHAVFLLTLARDESAEIETRIAGGSETRHPRTHAKRPRDFDSAVEARRAAIEKCEAGWARISASNGVFDTLLARSQADLTSLISQNPESTFIMAGIPWFATLFGRDSIITTMATLPFYPELTVETLRALARMQGSEVNAAREEQPGKIVHEIRNGEMALAGDVPFGRYYGSIDSTPLFLWLLGQCVSTTGNLGLAQELWPNVERAMGWIEHWGDSDGDGYVEYARTTPRGLENQGWKDSFDSVSHANGELAEPPIALAEVQGYVYAAYLSIADVARRLGDQVTSSMLLERARSLRAAFSRDFWLDRERTVALALDGRKRPCRVMSSNAAHCLTSRLLHQDRAAALTERLLADDMFSGWGIRTLSSNERRYNPMSYHNGSVWPHDNAMAAMGLARYGKRSAALRILEGLFDAAGQLDTESLPELFCGFPREPQLGPVPYPVACYPQAWSAASIFMILQAVLGIDVLGCEGRLVIDSPAIPSWLDWIRIEDLKVGEGSISLVLRRAEKGPATAEVLRKTGSIDVEMRK
jgi:glycogen debranching enzyme